MNQGAALNLDEVYIPELSVIHGNVRKEGRHRLKKGFIAFNSVSFGEVVNLSKSGMAIQYLAQRNASQDEMTEVNLINSKEGYLLGEIPCRMAYVQDTRKNGQNNVVRRIGVEFVDLSHTQQESLDMLLKRFSLGEEKRQQ